MSDRGCLHVARTDQLPLLDDLVATTGLLVDNLRRLDRDEISELVPIMNSDVIVAAVLEPGAMDLDVYALHQGFLRGCTARGGELQLNTEVLELARQDGMWHAKTPTDTFAAPIVINAAGAWADIVAELAGVMPLGLVPKRRTVFTFQPPDEFPCSDWPLVIDASEEYYFKASGGFLMVTPADETPVPPSDVQPEEIDVAIAIDRLEKNTCLKVNRIEHKWAGLRTFSTDKTPIVGLDPDADSFFWLAGQGGYGFQTSSAMARTATGLLTKDAIPQELIDLASIETACHRSASAPTNFPNRNSLFTYFW